MSRSMNGYLLVFLGAGLGGAARHGVNLAALRWFGAGFPWATLAVNVLGSLAMGVIAGWVLARAGDGLAHSVRLFVMTGILGGFTTFSAFSLDVVALHERGATGLALAYIAASVLASILALWLGLTVMRGLA